MADVATMRNNPSPAARRAQSEPVTLDAKTIQWMAGLPQNLRPNQMATRFPHIANRLAATWNSGEECRRYFDEVLLDRRGDRQGLPERVGSELAALKNHFESVVFPTHQTVWDEIVSRPRG